MKADTEKSTRLIRNLISVAVRLRVKPEAMGDVLVKLSEEQAKQVAYGCGGSVEDAGVVREVGKHLKVK